MTKFFLLIIVDQDGSIFIILLTEYRKFFTDPYRWASLSLAQQPFSEETVQKILPLIDNTDFVRELGNDLRNIFRVNQLH